MPRVLAADPDGVAAAVAHLGHGLPVAVPTDTVYGLAGPEARLRDLKQRPAELPIAVLAADADAATRRGDLGARGRILADRFWPGPLTLVVTDRLDPAVTVGLRVPGHDRLRTLIHAVGGTLPTTSANLHGRPTPTDAEGVADVFAGAGDLLVLDGGPCPGQASTVARLTADGSLEVLREGTVTAAELRQALATQLG